MNGYELREHDEFYEEIPWAPETETPPYICPLGGPGQSIVQFELFTSDSGNVITDLKNLGNADEEVLAFSNKWGQLERIENSKKALLDFRDQLIRVYESRSKFSELEKMMIGQTLGDVSIQFERRAKGRGPVDALWYLGSLRDFCLLGVIEDLGGIAGSTQIKCLACEKWFQRSGVKGPAPEHCSNACRQRAYNVRKKIGDRHKRMPH